MSTSSSQRSLKITSDERYTLGLIYIAILVVYGLIILFLGDGHVKQDELFIYLLSLSVGPVIGHLLAFRLFDAGTADAAGRSDLYFLLLPVACLLLAACLSLAPEQYTLFFPVVIGFAVLIALGLKNKSPFQGKDHKLAFHISLYFSIILPTLFFIFSLFYGPKTVGYIALLNDNNAMVYGVVVGVIATALLLYSTLKESAPRGGHWLIAGCGILVISVSLFDPNLAYNDIHYDAYLGPAHAVASGNMPLVDTYCQYGLGYLIYAIAFRFLPASYALGAAVTVCSNLIYYALIVLILRKVVTSRSLLIGSFVLIVFYHLAYPANHNLYPSNSALRFLPPTLLILSLLSLPDRKHFSVWSVLCLGLASLWSMETLVFSSVSYAGFIVFRAWAFSGEPWVAIWKGLVGLIGSLAGAFVFLYLLVFMLSGQWPRYDLYLSMLFAYTDSGKESIGADWQILFTNDFWLWLPVYVGYFLVLAWSIRLIFVGHKQCQTEDLRRFSYLFLLAIYGVVIFSFYLGRGHESLLLCVSIPFLVLSFSAFDWLLVKFRANRDAYRFSICSWGAYFGVFYLFLMVGVVVNLLAPYAKDNSNSTLIRHIFSGESLSATQLDRILRPDEHKEGANALAISENEIDSLISECQFLAKKWLGDESSLLLFTPHLTRNLILSGKPHALPIGNRENDDLSPPIVQKIIDEARVLNAGSLLIAAKRPVNMHWLDIKILQTIAEKWDFDLVSEGRFLNVYKLVPVGTGSAIVELPVLPIGVEASSYYQMAFPERLLSTGNANLWSSKPSGSMREEWIAIELPEITTIDRLDINGHLFDNQFLPRHFRLETSLDGVTWELLTDVSLAEDTQNTGVRISFPVTQAKYIRLTGNNRMGRSGFYCIQISRIYAYEAK